MHASQVVGNLVVSVAVRLPKKDCRRCRGKGILGVNKVTGEIHRCTCVTRMRSYKE